MTTFDDAIESAVAQVRTVVAFTGSLASLSPTLATLVTDVQIDRGVNDLPDSVTEVYGSTSAQATLTLSAQAPDGTKALDLSPYSTAPASVASLTSYGLGAGVTVSERVQDASGATQDYRLFTGRVTGFQPQTDGSVTVTCLDYADQTHGTVPLPAAVQSDSLDSTSYGLGVVGAVNLALHRSGLRVTPTTRVGAILSVPAVGSPLPLVGSYLSCGQSQAATPPAAWTAVTGKLPCAVRWSANAAQTWFAAGPMTWVEGWFTGGASDLFALTVDAAGRRLAVHLNADGSMTLTGSAIASGGITTAASYWPDMTAMHYVALGVAIDGTVKLQVDSLTMQSGTIVWTSGVSFDGTTIAVTRSGIGVQAWFDSATAPSLRNTWTPTVSVSYEAIGPDGGYSQPTVMAVRQQRAGDGWDLIKTIAEASGAVAGFDESGTFVWTTRKTWRAKRFQAAARTITQSRITDIGFHWSTASLTQSASANVAQWSVTTAPSGPAWTASDVYTCPGNRTRTYSVQLDNTLVWNVAPARSGLDGGSKASWFQAVASTSVGDPAAIVVNSVSVVVTPSAAGLKIAITNQNSFPVSLWTPGDGGAVPMGPYLRVYGSYATLQSPVEVSSSARGDGASVSLNDNDWRQDINDAQSMADDIAHDLAMPLIVFDSVQIPIDPRRKLGDVILLQDTRSMASAQPVQVVGIAHDLPAEDMHMTTLTVRACYPPTGWILDLPGRSELDSTAVLVV